MSVEEKLLQLFNSLNSEEKEEVFLFLIKFYLFANKFILTSVFFYRKFSDSFLKIAEAPGGQILKQSDTFITELINNSGGIDGLE